MKTYRSGSKLFGATRTVPAVNDVSVQPGTWPDTWRRGRKRLRQVVARAAF